MGNIMAGIDTKLMTKVCVLAIFCLSGCAQDAEESVLPGPRETLAEAFGTSQLPSESVNKSRSARVVRAGSNNAWLQSHASPSTRVAHAALANNLTLAWAAPIGEGDSRRQRITATPVGEKGRIFTLDSATQVAATSKDGQTLWTRNLTPVTDDSGEATGGAMALGGGRLYVATAFGRLVALDPVTGDTLWTQRLGNTGTGAPTYIDGVVYIVSGDTTGWAIEADTGRLRWQLEALADINNVAGGPAPAVSDQYTVFAFGSGELQATFRQGGLRMWNASLASRRDGLALALVDDITGYPVIKGNRLYAGNFSGSFTALDMKDGSTVWTTAMGALGPAWVTRDSVFLVSDLNELVRLDTATGEVVWRVDLPGYIETRRPQNRRVGTYVHHGPVLAGGRLVVASSDELLRMFSLQDGQLLETVKLPDPATTAPIVIDDTLYVVTSRGELVAFR
jgi:outer membrane protein assembly factor BamB